MNKNYLKIFSAISIALIFYTSCQYEKLQPFGEGCDKEISYKDDIVPIINTYCVSCHAANNGAIGDFSTYTGLKTDADNGMLNMRVLVLKDMPQLTPMDDELRNKISCWIKQGARNN